MEARPRWSTFLAAVLVLPAVVFVAANVLGCRFGADAPSTVLGHFAEPGEGAWNGLGRSDGTVEATVSILLEWARVAIALVALAMLAVLAGHIAAENAACWLGLRSSLLTGSRASQRVKARYPAIRMRMPATTGAITQANPSRPR